MGEERRAEMGYLIKSNVINALEEDMQDISKILTVSIIVMSSPLWVMPYLIFHIYDIMQEI